MESHGILDVISALIFLDANGKTEPLQDVRRRIIPLCEEMRANRRTRNSIIAETLALAAQASRVVPPTNSKPPDIHPPKPYPSPPKPPVIPLKPNPNPDSASTPPKPPRLTPIPPMVQLDKNILIGIQALPPSELQKQILVCHGIPALMEKVREILIQRALDSKSNNYKKASEILGCKENELRPTKKQPADPFSGIMSPTAHLVASSISSGSLDKPIVLFAQEHDGYSPRDLIHTLRTMEEDKLFRQVREAGGVTKFLESMKRHLHSAQRVGKLG